MKILWIMEKQLDTALNNYARVEMIKGLNKRRHQVILLTGYKREKKYYELNNSIIYVPSLKVKYINFMTFNISLFFTLIRYLFFYRPHVVIFCPSSALISFPLILFKKLFFYKSKSVLDIRTIPVETNGISGKLEEIFFHLSLIIAKRFFDGITVISPFMKKVISQKVHIDEKKIGVWTSAVSSRHFNPYSVEEAKVKKIRKDLDLDGKFVLIYHGTLSPNRGVGNVIKAVDLIKGDLPQVVFIIIGDGPEKTNLEILSKSLNLENNMRIIGRISYEDIPSYIAVGDVGILPFPGLMWWRVSSPIKLFEYMAMEKPIIVTDIEGHRDVLGSLPYAIFISSNKPEHIASAISSSYKNLIKIKDYAKMERKMVENEYSWDYQAKRLEDYLVSL